METVTLLQQTVLSPRFSKVGKLRTTRRVRTVVTLSMIILGPLLVIATFVIYGAFDGPNTGSYLQLIGLVDLIYALVVAGLVSRQIVKIIVARRHRSAGSQLHSRLTAVFTLTALVPTVLVAIFATVILNFVFEGWFSERVGRVVNNSLTAAQAYQSEHRINLDTDVQSLAKYLNAQKIRSPLMTTGDLREYLNRGQLQMQRTLAEAYVIDSAGQIVARGERSYLFDFEEPNIAQLTAATLGDVVIIEDWSQSEFRALVALPTFANRMLYVTRNVDGNILSLLDETQETVVLYNQLAKDRGKLLFEFALIYLGFALIVILAAVWFGMWFAEKLSHPVGRLASAAERVRSGDLDVQVVEGKGDDEIATLGRVFNRMVKQVKTQRDELVDGNAKTEEQRRLFDSVLSGVTAGVIGLDSAGGVAFMNSSAQMLLGLAADTSLGGQIVDTVPEFKDLFERLYSRTRSVIQGEVEVIRDGTQETLLVRMAARKSSEGNVEGYVISFDDVTDLVSAQRMAAWGDVARRIAHEVKNPLTPIQLAAERLQHKFGPMVGEERERLEQYTDVIIRQTGDLRRIVDEFAKFARMPAPEKHPTDISDILLGVVLLQNGVVDGVHVALDAPDEPIVAMVDPTLIGQAFTNLVKNACESVTSKMKTSEIVGAVNVSISIEDGQIIIEVVDNGIGLPAQRARLFEPYVTNRENGTGLGLSIVKKIIEEHGGKLELLDAPVFKGCKHVGALARITLQTIESDSLKDTNDG